MTIKAIETRYKGYRFRSRLEARWAVFFDALGWEWQYEPQGFEKDGCCYLPDFYLPRSKTWVEVKGCDEMLADDVDCLETILDWGSPLSDFDDSAQNSHCSAEAPGLLILGQIPEPRFGLCFHRIVQHYKGLIFNWAFMSPQYPEVMKDRLLDFFRPDPLESDWTTRTRFVPTTNAWYKVVNAYSAARSARFEHGESPLWR